MPNTPNRRAALLSAVAAFCVATGLHAQSLPPASNDPLVISGMGTSSEQHRVSFEGDPDGTAIVKKVLVKPGDTVKANDPLLIEDTSLLEAQLAADKAAADATGAIEEAVATIDAKTKTVESLKNLKLGNYSGKDMIDAQMELDVAKARKKQAEEERDRYQKIYLRDQVKLDHMTLKSPIDGIVESINLFEGEAVDATGEKQGAVFIISNNPLWVEFHLDTQKALRLAMHDPVNVAFPDKPDQWIKGEVVFLDPNISFTGQNRMVRVSIPNPQNQPSGLRMWVRLPAKVLDDASAYGAAQP
jgi:multidrug efflux pump subunit AcrA (membrane-fusion protein)